MTVYVLCRTGCEYLYLLFTSYVYIVALQLSGVPSYAVASVYVSVFLVYVVSVISSKCITKRLLTCILSKYDKE